MVDNTKAMLASLPPTNWVKRGQDYFPPEGEEVADAEIYDMFLHPRDCSFSVPELYDLLDRTGLRLVEYGRDCRVSYKPWFPLESDDLRKAIAKLSKREQEAVAELYWASIHVHVLNTQRIS